ncbi:hypothetical protein I6F26_31425 [Ensifer sp. IC3342]|nr:hypothetical protein [Ensifer sp. BRP08]MCA1451001.1 hypothetical protein [Ensifer sp. IC3342]
MKFGSTAPGGPKTAGAAPLRIIVPMPLAAIPSTTMMSAYFYLIVVVFLCAALKSARISVVFAIGYLRGRSRRKITMILGRIDLKS